jgi:hypothetical protein
MKHLSRVTVVKADIVENVDVDALLARIFAFILDILQLKGKGPVA